MSNTSNLVLPFLAVGQAQKHVTVNESLRRLDALVQLSVISASVLEQPASPLDGSVYIMAPGKSGAAWSTFADGSLGYYRDGSWEQLNPREGWLAFVRDTDQLLAFDGSQWSLFAGTNLIRLSDGDCVLGRASSGAGAAEEIAFTAQARALCDDASPAEMCATLGAWRVLAASGVAATHTGDTAETVLASVSVPAGAMGPNGILRVTAMFSHSSSINTKTLRIRLGGPAGAEVLTTAASSNRAMMVVRTIHNRDVEAMQVTSPAGTATSLGAANIGPTTLAVDTSLAQDLVFSGQLANASDTVTLESWIVEIAYGA